MKRDLQALLFVVVISLLILVCGGWYAAENFSGRLSRGVTAVGEVVVWPGRMADAIASGNFHGGFGGWRSGGIRIIASWLAWSSPLLAVWGVIGRQRHECRIEN